ncbi:hypothetical protein ACQ4PT_048623 [Festuca glaucescens]
MSTKTRTTAGNGEDNGSTRSSAAAHWSDIPDDLLGNIRLRLDTGRDRASLASVCRQWHAALLRTAPPVVPLLLLSPQSRSSRTKRRCSGGPAFCCVIPIPDKAANKCLVGSHDGGWVAAFDFDSHELTVMNLCSGAELGVCGGRLESPISHVVFSDSPTSSSGCILATITNGSRSIAMCKVGCRRGWILQDWKNKMFTHITFCSGYLYGLTYPDEELIKFKVGMDEDGSPMFESTHQLAIESPHRPTTEDDPNEYECYILELNGKLSMATRDQWLSKHEPFFKIFELVDADDAGEAFPHKWMEVTSLGNYALFLGPTRSKAVPVPVGAETHGFERNHIYYSKATRSGETILPGDEVYSWKCDNDRLMFCREDQSIGDGLERTGYFIAGWGNAAMWIHPPDLYPKRLVGPV